jgi:hypothetical protein
VLSAAKTIIIIKIVKSLVIFHIEIKNTHAASISGITTGMSGIATRMQASRKNVTRSRVENMHPNFPPDAIITIIVGTAGRL